MVPRGTGAQTVEAWDIYIYIYIYIYRRTNHRPAGTGVLERRGATAGLGKTDKDSAGGGSKKGFRRHDEDK